VIFNTINITGVLWYELHVSILWRFVSVLELVFSISDNYSSLIENP